MNTKKLLLLTASVIFIFFVGKSQENPIVPASHPIGARIAHNQLQVEWTTPAEKNVKHYIIEISKDGSTFMKAGIVLSKTEGGNSTAPVSYTFTRSVTGLLTGTALFLLPLLGFSVNKGRSNRTKVIVATLFIGGATLVGCRKLDNPEVTKAAPLYLRLVQVDQANHSLYSQTVKVG